MKIPSSLDYEINVNSRQAKKAVSELTKAVENLGLAFAKYRNVELTYSISEKKKKKWFEFWKL